MFTKPVLTAGERTVIGRVAANSVVWTCSSPVCVVTCTAVGPIPGPFLASVSQADPKVRSTGGAAYVARKIITDEFIFFRVINSDEMAAKLLSIGLCFLPGWALDNDVGRFTTLDEGDLGDSIVSPLSSDPCVIPVGSALILLRLTIFIPMCIV